MSKKNIASLIEETKTIVSQYGKRNFSYVDKDLESTVDGTISENGVTFRTCDGGSCFYGWTHERLEDSIEMIVDDIRKSIASIEELKKIAEKYGVVSFTILDNCPDGGMDGRLTESGIYMLGNNHFKGEFFTFDSSEVEELADEILDAVKSAIEPVEQLKNIADEYGVVSFTIPDNCPDDGWDGRLTKIGVYMFGNNHFEGEFFKYSDPEVKEWAEEILDAVMVEIDEDDEEEGTTSENIEEVADPSLKKNTGENYESLVTLKLNRNFKARFPIAYQNKVDELIDEGLAENETEAAEIMKDMEVELELYYEKGRGFFAVETEAVECSPIFSPYSKKELLDE